jgi:hypothetical protein
VGRGVRGLSAAKVGRRDDSELAMAGGWAGAPCPVLTLAGAFTFRMQLTAPGHSTTFLRLQERCARRFVCCLSPAREESPGPSACALQVGVGRDLPPNSKSRVMSANSSPLGHRSCCCGQPANQPSGRPTPPGVCSSRPGPPASSLLPPALLHALLFWLADERPLRTRVRYFRCGPFVPGRH